MCENIQVLHILQLFVCESKTGLYIINLQDMMSTLLSSMQLLSTSTSWQKNNHQPRSAVVHNKWEARYRWFEN